jgi:hypothetical protein
LRKKEFRQKTGSAGDMKYLLPMIEICRIFPGSGRKPVLVPERFAFGLAAVG